MSEPSPTTPHPPHHPHRGERTDAVGRWLPAMYAVLFVLLGVFIARAPVTYRFLTGNFDFADGIVEVRGILEREAVEEVDDHQLQGAAIAGMLDSLNDDYAQYVSPEEQREFAKMLTSSFVGIGVQVMPDGVGTNEYLTVVSPLEDTPAYRAGIQAGDKISEIDGTSTRGLTVDECIKLLTGEPGTNVALTILRPRVVADGKKIEADASAVDTHSTEPTLAGDEEIHVTIERAEIVSSSVRGIRRRSEQGGEWDYMIDPDRRIAYARLSQFTPTAPLELAKALFAAGADQPGFGGLILDLRDNPGGMIDAAITIADLFLDSGTIVSTRGRAQGENQTYSAKAGDTFPDFPIIVLVNGNSASASEMLSGALKDHGRALIVGTRTYGKGLVQTVKTPYSLGGAQIKFTAARYYLPSGKLIQRTDDAQDWGVDPDSGFYVPMTNAERLAAFRKRRDADILRQQSELDRQSGDAETEQHWSDPSWIGTQMSDKQLAAALTTMQVRLQSDARRWQPVAPPDAQHGRLALDELRTLEKQQEQLFLALSKVGRRIETLRQAAEHGEEAAPKPPDLWPDDAAVVGGTIEIKDAAGHVVATLPITLEDLEQRLIDAGVGAGEHAAP